MSTMGTDDLLYLELVVLMWHFTEGIVGRPSLDEMTVEFTRVCEIAWVNTPPEPITVAV